ncbi:tripartite tricarboxylate transporter substrate binding protein [Variovorax sp. J22P168]|uniref:Bug family tripartite tricarboxylate transporter substrate binding protein n=1 Tax=Variovorax jilinensis TaxID=3053513 RepID=UPI00257579ED|nr:tripartite tricarboxylate transporter substrate binding protein [Variovorax sp. J22P168]MDM0015345.1 tripartite tricarboxylate transporter substrate binding protein [Variovorax sp. J22P168]
MKLPLSKPKARRARRLVLALFAGLAVLAQMPAAVAQTAYPSKTVTLVVPGPAGGITDQLGRLIATKVGERLGRTVIVDNRAGAGGNLAAEAVARAEPDGYTLLMGTQGTQATNQFLYKNLHIDPERDFVPVHALISIPNILVVNASRPYRTVKELTDYARANPGKLTVASAGNGTGTHLSAELFQAVAGVKFVHVPYRGSAPAINDLLGGTVDLSFDYPITTLGHVEAGKLRALAVTGPNRLAALPQVPTIAEAGYPAAESTSWIGLFFPARTPAAAVDRWKTELDAVLRDPAVVESLARMGGAPLMLSGAKFGSFVQGERSKWKDIIQRSGATVD